MLRANGAMAVFPRKPRKHSEEIADWASAVPWQWFITATLPWNAREETVQRKFRLFHNELERLLHAKVAFIVSIESRAKNGDIVGRHLHSVMASHGPLSSRLIEAAWLKQIGRWRELDSTSVHVRVEQYESAQDNSREGLEYILKHTGDDYGWWDLKWLEEFNTQMLLKIPINHKSIRAKRRSVVSLQSMNND